MTNITTVGLDLAKLIFQIHGADKNAAMANKTARVCCVGDAQPG